MSDRNPKRGCGTKSNDSFYLEGEVGDGGGLLAWTWFLGDGLDHILTVDPHQIPTRSVVTINPAATLTLEQFVGGNYPYEFTGQMEQKYRYFQGKTRTIGSADHVGAQHYTAWSFALEVDRLGPSRKITRQMAKAFAEIFQNNGPFPMLFSHSIPLMTNEQTRNNLLSAVNAAMIGEEDWGYWMDAVWMHDEWGQYASRGQTPGYASFLVPVLEFIDTVSRLKSVQGPYPSDKWYEAEKLVNALRFEDQIFGGSWMTRLTYTLPEEGKEEAEERVRNEIPGIDILDLEDYEYQRHIDQVEGTD